MTTPTRSLTLLGALFLLAGAAVAQQQPSCNIQQITGTGGSGRSLTAQPSLDDGTIAFAASGSPAGGSARQIVLWNGALTRVTSLPSGSNVESPSLQADFLVFSSDVQTRANPDGTQELLMTEATPPLVSAFFLATASSGDSEEPRVGADGNIAFESEGDLIGRNPDGNSEIFLFDRSSRRTRQITESSSGNSSLGSFENGVIAFYSDANLVGANPDHNFEIFVYDGSGITQVTETQGAFNGLPALSEDATRMAFLSEADLTGRNPDGSEEVFVAERTGSPHFTQVTDTPSGPGAFPPSISEDGSWVAFSSSADMTGDNPDGSVEVFLDYGSGIIQVTDSAHESFAPSLSGHEIAFVSDADLTGENPERNDEIFLARCTPAPPSGPYLTTPALPGFRFKVRITQPNGNRIIGQKVTPCPAETLCVSGALPGRSELYLRIIGPRPNSFLWDNVVRFTPSRVEVWAEQISTGELNYYDLPKIPRRSNDLSGLVDKEAFQP